MTSLRMWKDAADSVQQLKPFVHCYVVSTHSLTACWHAVYHSHHRGIHVGQLRASYAIAIISIRINTARRDTDSLAGSTTARQAAERSGVSYSRRRRLNDLTDSVRPPVPPFSVCLRRWTVRQYCVSSVSRRVSSVCRYVPFVFDSVAVAGRQMSPRPGTSFWSRRLDKTAPMSYTLRSLPEFRIRDGQIFNVYWNWRSTTLVHCTNSWPHRSIVLWRFWTWQKPARLNHCDVMQLQRDCFVSSINLNSSQLSLCVTASYV